MTNISTTQIANYVAMAMFLVQLFDINISSEELTTIITGIVGVGAVLYSFYKRYKQGDLFLLGGRKFRK